MEKDSIIFFMLFIIAFISWPMPLIKAEQSTNIPETVLNYGNLKEKYDFYYVKDWNGYEVYTIILKEQYPQPRAIGAPIFLLYDGKTVRRDVGEEYLNFCHKGRIILYRERPH